MRFSRQYATMHKRIRNGHSHTYNRRSMSNKYAVSTATKQQKLRNYNENQFYVFRI